MITEKVPTYTKSLGIPMFALFAAGAKNIEIMMRWEEEQALITQEAL
jgi:hypothetical protein